MREIINEEAFIKFISGKPIIENRHTDYMLYEDSWIAAEQAMLEAMKKDRCENCCSYDNNGKCDIWVWNVDSNFYCANFKNKTTGVNNES
jgi:hypothetical protein